MTEEQITEGQGIENEEGISTSSLKAKFQMVDGQMALWTIIYSILGALLYVGISLVPMPFVMVNILKFGLLPAVVVIALVGAIRGPIAGFIAGYLGEVLYGILVYNHIVTLTLPAMAFGVLGFIAGFATYDFANGRSLAKLSVLSAIGFVFTVLLVVVIGITIEDYSILAAIAFNMLPLLTTGLPTLIFVTPVIARIWLELVTKMDQPESSE
ncbi:MAG: hypothetical protein ACTSV2_05645 [Candidatus Thorarchaeota archaeon]